MEVASKNKPFLPNLGRKMLRREKFDTFEATTIKIDIATSKLALVSDGLLSQEIDTWYQHNPTIERPRVVATAIERARSRLIKECKVTAKVRVRKTGRSQVRCPKSRLLSWGISDEVPALKKVESNSRSTVAFETRLTRGERK